MIYCVEDDAGIRELVVYALTASGFEAKGFASADEFWAAMSEEKPELVILDIMLPGEDGMTTLKKIRGDSNTANVPVIMATAKGTEYDKVIGLDSGADDYLAKPFGMMEMVSRVRAVLRRAGTRKQDKIVLDNIEINLTTHRVYSDGAEVILTLKEYELLQLFAQNIGRVFTREILLDKIWGTTYVGESRTVDVHIGTLRAKLGEAGNRIETVRGVGYRME